MNSGQLSQEVIQTKAKTIGSKLGSWPTTPSVSVVIAAASLSQHEYLTRVEWMRLENINLACVSFKISAAHRNGFEVLVQVLRHQITTTH